MGRRDMNMQDKRGMSVGTKRQNQVSSQKGGMSSREDDAVVIEGSPYGRRV